MGRFNGNTGLSVISFRSQQLRQVGCYTVLSGFQPSWPPTCYHQQLTSFCGFLDEPASQAPQPCTRFTPRRQYCLPVMAHMEPHHSPVRTSTSTHPLASERTPAQCPWTLPSHNAPLARPPWGSGISRARLQFDDRSKGRGPPKSLSCIARHHKTRYPAAARARSRPGSSYPEGNFEGNQLLGGSMSLSPLYATPTIDLHVRMAYQPPPRFPTASL